MSAAYASQIKDFTSGKIFKPLVFFSIPLFLSSFMQMLYNMADMAIVGNVEGAVGSSAVSVGGDVNTFLTFLAIGFGHAIQVLVARLIGANKRDKLGKFVGNTFGFMFTGAIIISILGLTFQSQILALMKTPAEALEGAIRYSTITMLGLVFTYGYNIISAVLRGMGDSKHPFIFISVAAITNVILDLLFVAVFKMGAGGAALATIVSQAISFISCAILMIRRRKEFSLDIKVSYLFKWDKSVIFPLVKLGTPLALRSAAIQFSKLFVNSFINGYGLVVSAFTGISHKITNVVNQLALSCSTAGSTMIGQNVVANKFDRVKRIMASVATLTLSITVIASTAMVLFPRAIFSIFTSDGDEAVLSMVNEYLPIALLLFLGSGLRPICNSLVVGSANTTLNFIVGILDGIVLRIGLAVLCGLVFEMGYFGFWLGDALAGFAPFIIGFVFFLTGKWKKKQKLE